LNIMNQKTVWRTLPEGRQDWKNQTNYNNS
jgi:hypothetical protein